MNIFPLDCVCYISASHKRVGVMHAILGSSLNNSSFVQEMDESGIITDFIEFTDFDFFYSVPASQGISAHIGGHGVIAYFLPDGSLVETNLAELQREILENNFDFSQLPTLTQIHIQRLTYPRKLYSGDLLSKFSEEHGFDKKAKSVFYRANVKSIQESSMIWRKLREIPPAFRPKEADHQADRFELEDLIRDLFSREINDRWIKQYIYLLKRIVFDDRILELGIRLINDDSVKIFEMDNIASKIIPRLIDLAIYISGRSVSSDFWDALIDPILSGDICTAVDDENINTIAGAINTLKSSEAIRKDAMSVFVEGLRDPFISAARANVLAKHVLTGLAYAKNDISNIEIERAREQIFLIFQENARLQIVLDTALAEEIADLRIDRA